MNEPAPDEPTIAATNVLRVRLEGITEGEAAETLVTLSARLDPDASGARVELPADLWGSWRCLALTNEFELDAFFARVAEHFPGVPIEELQVDVDHPAHFLETTRVPLSSGVELSTGQTVYEIRVSMVRPEFWPEFTLAVRDVRTRVHLEDIELRVKRGDWSSIWGRNVETHLLAAGLRSPIALQGGRDPTQPEGTFAGMGLSAAGGESPHLVELGRSIPLSRGVAVSARAPGYAWGTTELDVSRGDRELLLEPAAQLSVRLTNVQLERYRVLESKPLLCVYGIRKDGGNQWVHFEPLDEALEAEGLRLDHLRPGGYRVTVELAGGSWEQRPVLARKELSGEFALTAGETRDLVLALADPPPSPERATLGGVVSLGAFAMDAPEFGYEKVRLQLYHQPTQRWRKPRVEFSLDDLRRTGGVLPTWSFRAENLPVGRYRVQLLPFLKVWMIDLPGGGHENLELVLEEIAQVLVETVDERTGEGIPLDEFYFRRQNKLPGQEHNEWLRADTEEPGRFRFWTAPGAVSVWPKGQGQLGYGRASMDLELVSGLQSVRFELGPIHAMYFVFREDGAELPAGYKGMNAGRDIRAVDHEGRITGDGFQSDNIVEVSAPGIYEINFEGLSADQYEPIPPRRVEVRSGETTEVIVELRPK